MACKARTVLETVRRANRKEQKSKNKESYRGMNMGEFTDWIKANFALAASITLFFLLILGLSYVYLHAQPALLKQERENYKASYQYSESKDTELIKFVSSYNQLETQKQGLVDANETANAKRIDDIEIEQQGIANQIYQDVELVPDKSRLPDSVKQFLRDHPEDHNQ
jgi:uncharacterized protein HemX